MSSQDFSTILKKYSAVDTRFGTDKDTSHSYGEVYSLLFSNYKNTSSLLEIGFDGGASLLAYAEYFQNATIHGIDIVDRGNPVVQRHPRIRTYFGNATNPTTISHFNTTYDIIIEDASHLLEDQIQHFHDFSPFVNIGGIYIIEDISEVNKDKLQKELFDISREKGFEPCVCDLREKKNRFDDILFVFKRVRNPVYQ